MSDRASRTSVRARILGQIDRLKLPQKAISVRSLSEEELRNDPGLLGSIIVHLDFSSRSALTSSEVIFTAASGKVLIAEHPDLPGFPVGISLLLPVSQLPRGRRQLFAAHSQGWGQAPIVIQYALATNPGNLGAAKALQLASQNISQGSRFISYAPLTGLRARIIQIVDDERVWNEVSKSLTDKDSQTLRRQLSDLLARDTAPDFLDQPAKSLLESQAQNFAKSSNYRIGEFHRYHGATLLDFDHGGDPSESDSMWTRAFLEYA